MSVQKKGIRKMSLCYVISIGGYYRRFKKKFREWIQFPDNINLPAR
jgi:hypothetical protein